MIFGAEMGGQFIRHNLQHAIADLMAVFVIEMFEVVHIDDHDADLVMTAGIIGFVEIRAVVQPGEGVMGGSIGEGFGFRGVILQDFVINIGQMADFVAALHGKRFPLVQFIHAALNRGDDQEPVQEQGNNCYNNKEKQQKLLAPHDLFDMRRGLPGAVFALLRGNTVAVVHGGGKGFLIKTVFIRGDQLFRKGFFFFRSKRLIFRA